MIKLISNYPYDNRYDFSKSFSVKSDQTEYFNTFTSITINPFDEENEEGYIKEGEAFIVNYNYDDLVLQGINYVTFKNKTKTIYAFIVKKEYVNDEATKLYYEVDVIQTFMFDFAIRKSFVERKKCTIDEITDFDEGIDIGEHIIDTTTEVFTKGENYFAMFSGFKDYNIVNGQVEEVPYYNDSRPITKIDGIRYPFMLIALDTEVGVDTFYKYLVDMPNLLGIIRMPDCVYEITTVTLPIIKIVDNNVTRSFITCPKVVPWIIGNYHESAAITINKTNIYDFFPYTYYVLTDGETDPLIMHPQYLSDSLSIKFLSALSHTPVERYYPNYYKGDTKGTVYNITNSSVMMLPTGTNGGMETVIASANQIQQQKSSIWTNILVGVTVGAVGLATGGIGLAIGAAALGGGIASGISAVKENMARNKDLELTPSTIKSFGTPSTRNVFGNNKVKIIKYTIKDIYKTRLLSYVDRYSNKFNNYAELDLKTYKGYVKYLQPNIDSKIDNMYINTITSILERGIYFE